MTIHHANGVEIDFDEDTHTYRIGGVIVPSVTQIIAPLAPDYSFVDADVMERASEFGRAVHKACELDDNNDLDWRSLDESLVPYVDAWRLFKNDFDFCITANEKIVVSETYRYSGRLDRCGFMKLSGDEAVIDIKTCTSIHPVTGVQLSGYAHAAKESGLFTKKRIRRIAVQLKGNGLYSFHEFAEPIDDRAFLACLNLFQWRQKYAA